jgi:hypothetical protein
MFKLAPLLVVREADQPVSATEAAAVASTVGPPEVALSMEPATAAAAEDSSSTTTMIETKLA